MEPLVFESLEPISIPVTLGEKKYVLKEAPEALYCKYLDALMKAGQVIERPDGKKEVAAGAGIYETESLLVSYCLFEVTENGGLRAVDQKWVANTLTHRIVKPLFKKAEMLCEGTAKMSEEQLKNSSGATTGTSV